MRPECPGCGRSIQPGAVVVSGSTTDSPWWHRRCWLRHLTRRTPVIEVSGGLPTLGKR